MKQVATRYLVELVIKDTRLNVIFHIHATSDERPENKVRKTFPEAHVKNIRKL